MKIQTRLIKVFAVAISFALLITSSLSSSSRRAEALQATATAQAAATEAVAALQIPTSPLVPCTAGVTSPCDLIATKAADIVGVWILYFNAQPAFIRYNADGTWLIADTVEHTNAVSVKGYPSGTFSFNKDVFTSADPTLPKDCTAGHYILRIIKVNGQPVALNHALVEDCFAPRRSDWAYIMLWVSGK